MSIPAKVEGEGRVVVPAKMFVDLINSIDEEKVELEEGTGKLYLRSKSVKSSFSTQAVDDFPNFLKSWGRKRTEFSKKTLENTLSRVVFAAAQDSSRPALSGVLIKSDAGELNIVATDGYRLSLKSDKKALVGKEYKSHNKIFIISARILKRFLAEKNKSQ